MADDHARAELAQLRTLVESQQGQLAALQVQIAALQTPHPERHRHRRRFLPLALVALLLALMPLATVAADFAFLDLNSGSPHNDNIAAIKAAGITKGCNPPAYDNYCPNGTVTREEMASFLARTAGLGSNPPVVNAKTAQTATTTTNAQNAAHATSADTATSAGNANTVAGYAPSGLVRVAHASGGNANVNLTTVFQTVATVTIAAPMPGFVLVFGTASYVTTLNTSVQIEYRLRDTATGGTASSVNRSVIRADVNSDQTGSQNYVFPVMGGVSATYVLEARYYSGMTTVYAYYPQLTALFVPFGGTGAPPAP